MFKLRLIAVFVALLTAFSSAQDLWQLAKEKQSIHRFSTLFTAQQVRDHLARSDRLEAAVEWCRKTGVTKVYIETFRGYWAERSALENAKKRFAEAGIEVSGCVTTVNVLKRSTGWNLIACYTDRPTQEKIRSVFEFTAGLFDEIMIDDFWFTDCTCKECDAARAAKTVTIGDKTFPVSGDTWEDYRCELMVQLSRLYVLEAARKVNPRVKVIIKYPQWYDNFHERGYEVVRQTRDFDRIWVGTETRNYDDKQWGGTPQYEAYFIMRWLGGLGGEKCGGGWYDPYGTTEATYLEQARQTILGGAHESMLFCYGSLLEQTGPKNVQTLRENIPELFNVAAEVSKRRIIGIAAYKPANSRGEKEKRIFDFVGMMGLPLVPCHELAPDAQAAFLSIHAAKDPQIVQKINRMIEADRPVLMTDALAKALEGKVNRNAPTVTVLDVKGDPKALYNLTQQQVDAVREAMLKPFKRTFKAPNKVGLYLFEDGSWVIENFNDQAATVELDGATMQIPARGWRYLWK